ncbi:uncharacterized protein CDAR_584881 [Caerostris darwini]|uniref:RRM domain-containing protein n=1 Tax=Caerostris darwini TaxID=1538125 RepID=A0AAV4QP94_9ARAC|nr:uncharacterized protein CDAR_584881 [Caerostris darwini]
MSCDIYVGNFPISLNKEVILDLFQDFSDIEMIGFFKNPRKCYSFFKCVNQDQVIDVVTTMHNIDFCGRNLVVRAKNFKLQKEIEEAVLKNDIEGLKNKSKCMPYSANRNSQNHVTVDNFSCKKSSVYQPKTSKQNRSASDVFNFQNSHADEYHKYSQSNEIPDKQNDYSNPKCLNAYGGIDQNDNQNIKPQETFGNPCYKSINDRFSSYTSFSKKNDSFNCSESLRDAVRPNLSEEKPQVRTRNTSICFQETDDFSDTSSSKDFKAFKDDLNFVSVINFPLGLEKRDLYELFTDFNPVKIFMVCNKPRVDRKPTEAIVCFMSEQDATDAILTLDNTIYNGRVILVADVVDTSIVSELLSFGKLKNKK